MTSTVYVAKKNRSLLVVDRYSELDPGSFPRSRSSAHTSYRFVTGTYTSILIIMTLHRKCVVISEWPVCNLPYIGKACSALAINDVDGCIGALTRATVLLNSEA
jgi:hypothetical protein